MAFLRLIHRISFVLSLIVFGICLAKPLAAEATYSKRIKFAENNPISDSMCKIYYAVTGSIAKVISVFVVIVTALGFFLGKVSWGIIISIVVAISLMFTGRQILSVFVGPKADGGCECKKGTYSFGYSCKAKPLDKGT